MIHSVTYYSLTHDSKSCERIRTALDQLEPEKDVENFVNQYGTGNTISIPTEFQPSNSLLEPQQPGSPIIRHVEFQRVTGRVAPAYLNEQGPGEDIHSRQQSGDDAPHGHATATRNHDVVNGGAGSPYAGSVASRDGNAAPSVAPTSNYPTRSTASPPQTSPPNHPPPPVPEAITAVSSIASVRTRSPSPVPRPYRESQPLPVLPSSVGYGPGRSQTPPPPLPTQQQQGNKILFYGEPSDLITVLADVIADLAFLPPFEPYLITMVCSESPVRLHSDHRGGV